MRTSTLVIDDCLQEHGAEAARLDVLILGPLQVWDAREEVTLGGVKLQAVLAMLIVNVNRVVSLEYLAHGLWGDAAPVSATSTLQVYLSRLRQRLPAGTENPANGAIRRRRPGYLLELDENNIDLNRFRDLSIQGKRLLADDPETAATTLRQALQLWRGQPLAEFSALPFAQTEIPRLDDQWLSAVLARMDADLAVGRHSELIGEIESLLTRYPLHERLHEQLILSLYRSGRQAEALEAYRTTKRTFADELGIDPGRSLQDLEASILTQDRSLDHTPPKRVEIPAPAPSTVDQPPHPPVTDPARTSRIFNAPARNPHFIGRMAVLNDLHNRAIAAPNTLVVQALYGLGGVGKTHLAIEYVHRFADNYDVVWWVDADQPALLPDQFTALAHHLGLPKAATASETVARVLDDLGQRHRALLIFDNAEQPDVIAGYRPIGTGHVLITSRSPAWGALGWRVEVDVLNRQETIALLQARMSGTPAGIADQLANELGDLPLAASQAAAYLEQTGLAPLEYLERFRTRRAGLLARGEVFGYQGRVDTTWQLSLERLRKSNPTAVVVLELAAFLGPELIPTTLLTDHPALLPEPLRADLAADPDALDDAIGAMVGYSLARRRSGGFQLHRLLQAVIRNRLTMEEQRAVTEVITKMLAAAHPGDPNNLDHWEQYAVLAPHLLAAGHLMDDDADGRSIMLAAVSYINVRGDTRASRSIAAGLHQRWRNRLGDNHPDTLTAAAHLTSALTWLAEHAEARDLGQDTLARSQQVLGRDHPVTLRLATNLTFALAWLGETGRACELGVDSLRRASIVLGPDSPDTLRLAANLTFALAWNGDAGEARTVGTQALQRSREVLGPDHPITLVAAAHLGLALAWLGETDADRLLGHDALEQSRLALGEDHPTTLAWAAHLAFLLGVSGETHRARDLSGDGYVRASRALGPDHLITLALALAAVHAGNLVATGDPDEGRRLSQQTFDQVRTRLGAEHLITLIAATSLSAALLATANTRDGTILSQRTLETATCCLGPDHPLTKTLHRIVNAPR